MRKVALVFVLAVLLPSLVLAWLAVRSLRDQEFILERQQTLLCQSITDRVAQEAAEILAEHQREFARQVDALLADQPPRSAAGDFDAQIRSRWPLARVGFVVTLDGRMLNPSLTDRPEARQFRLDNALFLCNAEPAQIYWNSPKGLVPLDSQALSMPEDARIAKVLSGDDAPSANAGGQQLDQSQQPDAGQPAALNTVYKTVQQNRRILPQNYEEPGQQQASVQQALNPISKVTVAEAEFRQLIGDATEGLMSRFLQDQLNVMAWYRPPRDPQLVFGALLDLRRISEELSALVAQPERQVSEDVCVAILNDTALPVARSHPGFTTSWRRPFVAAEIGEALPHWEVGTYLLNPHSFSSAAATLRLTLSLLVASLIVAIGAGSLLITRDVQRQLALARQKTDFVSNVSHELKTPLTSIRMFSELLSDGRVKDEEKRRSYLAIITAETARLTRLINNVLDFSRLERGEKKYDFRPCDFAEVVREAAGNFAPQLESSGFRFQCELPRQPVMVHGDRDALAQVVLNLLSNAEKYSNNGTKEIAVELRREERPVPHVELHVADRGTGVPAGSEEKIFEQFYRAHDSLSSGIQGSGLGLTLARQIARAHGGDVTYEPRAGGGSTFAVRLPAETM
jgi:signal transduction histidine kinase